MHVITRPVVTEIKIQRASLGVWPGYSSPVCGEGVVLLHDVLSQLEAAHRSRATVLLSVDSLGGDSRAGSALFHALRSFREAGGRVVAFVSGYAGSIAAMYVLGADYLVADPGARFGLHGNRVEGADQDEGLRLYVEQLDDLQRRVFAARTLASPEDAARWASLPGDGELLDAEAAKGLGFVDLVGGRSEARRAARELALRKPLESDRQRALRACDACEELQPVREFGAGVISRVVTPVAVAHGHLQHRIENFARPLDLSLAALPRHITESMRDLAMRDNLISARDFLTDSRVRDAITDALGPAAYDALIDHWRRAANQLAVMRANWRTANRVRSAFAGGTIAWNIPVAAQHVTNIIPSFDRIPAAHMGRAVTEFASRGYGMERDIFPLSSYMYERIHESSSDLNIRKAIGEMTGRQSQLESISEQIRETGMLMIHGITRATADAAWQGAYQHAIAPEAEGGLGLSPEKDGPAVQHADQVVRLTQTSYRDIDRSLVEVHPVTKHFTQFYGYISSQMNMLFAAHADASVLWNQGFRKQAIARIVQGYSFVIAAGILAEVLTGKGPAAKKDKQGVDAIDWAEWAGATAVTYPLRIAPFGRSLVEGAMAETGRDMSLTPWLRSAEAFVKTVRETNKGFSDEATGDEAWKAGMEALETFGWFYGLPVAQSRRTADYWLDITADGPQQSEESRQAGPGEAAMGSVLGPRRPGKLNDAIFLRR